VRDIRRCEAHVGLITETGQDVCHNQGG